MATLKELCVCVPEVVLRTQRVYNYNLRKCASARAILQDLANETDVFDKCKQARPSRRKCHESASKEEAGRIGNVTITKRFGNSRLICVCSTKKW